MTDTISYQYAAPSALQRSAEQDELFLAKYSEIEKKEAPCFFRGRLTQPYMTARCLITLSNCAGVYARVDVLPDGHDGEFSENGAHANTYWQ